MRNLTSIQVSSSIRTVCTSDNSRGITYTYDMCYLRQLESFAEPEATMYISRTLFVIFFTMGKCLRMPDRALGARSGLCGACTRWNPPSACP